jgi:hypothetical protein
MNGMSILSALRLAISIGLSFPFFFFSQLFWKGKKRERKDRNTLETFPCLTFCGGVLQFNPQSTYRVRVEIGEVYLPSQLKRTLPTLTRLV